MFMHSGAESVQDQVQKPVPAPFRSFPRRKQLERFNMHVINADKKVDRAHQRDGCQLGVHFPEFAGLYAFFDDPEEDGKFLLYQIVD